MCAPDFAGFAVHHHRHRVAGVVDEQLLPAAVLLAHDQRQSPFPATEQIAETAVTVAVRMLGDVFFPQNLERHVLALQGPCALFGHRFTVGLHVQRR
jgi:hypothetical protein